MNIHAYIPAAQARPAPHTYTKFHSRIAPPCANVRNFASNDKFYGHIDFARPGMLPPFWLWMGGFWVMQESVVLRSRVRPSTCMYVCVFICMCLCMYMYVYVCITTRHCTDVTDMKLSCHVIACFRHFEPAWNCQPLRNACISTWHSLKLEFEVWT
jgi:hypothetical protein